MRSKFFNHLMGAVCINTAIAAGVHASENIDFTGLAELDTALEFKSANVQKSRLTLTPELSVELSPRSRLTLIGRLRFDVSDKLEPGIPTGQNRATLTDRWHINDEIEAEIREAYLDTEIGSTFLRLGKQQIVWGQADGLKVVDVLNPQSFSEFILPDFEDSRIPLWTANAEIPLKDWTLQLVWIPDTTYAEIPAPDATFALTSPLLVPHAPEGTSVTVLPVDKPSDPIEDSDIGIKLSAFLGGWDISFNYAYHYNDLPVLRLKTAPDTAFLEGTYERSHLVGGTFSTVFGDFIMRGEVGFATNQHQRMQNPADNNGVFRTNELSYVLGIDHQGFTDWLLSAQLFQSHLTNHPVGAVRDRTETRLTGLVRRTFMNEALSTEILAIHSLSSGDGLLQAAISYEWRSNIRLKAGADIFYGNKNGLFGQFSERDRITVGLEYSF